MRGWLSDGSVARYRGARGGPGGAHGFEQCGGGPAGAPGCRDGTPTLGKGWLGPCPASWAMCGAGGQAAAWGSPVPPWGSPCLLECPPCHLGVPVPPGGPPHWCLVSEGEGCSQQTRVGSSHPGPPCHPLEPVVAPSVPPTMPAGPGGAVRPCRPPQGSQPVPEPVLYCSPWVCRTFPSTAGKSWTLPRAQGCPAPPGPSPPGSLLVTHGTARLPGVGRPPRSPPCAGSAVPGSAGKDAVPPGCGRSGAAGVAGAESRSPSLAEHVPAAPQAGAVGSGGRGAPGAQLPALPR